MLVPLVAIGGAVVGGLIVRGLMSGSEKDSKKSEQAKQKEPTPDSYIVTRVSGDASREKLSAVEAVRNLVV